MAVERLTSPLDCCSINGHGVPQHSLKGELMMYTATKNGVQVVTEGLRRELVERKSKIKVTVKVTACLKSLHQLPVLFLICFVCNENKIRSSATRFETIAFIPRSQYLFFAVALVRASTQYVAKLRVCLQTARHVELSGKTRILQQKFP